MSWQTIELMNKLGVSLKDLAFNLRMKQQQKAEAEQIGRLLASAKNPITQKPYFDPRSPNYDPATGLRLESSPSPVSLPSEPEVPIKPIGYGVFQPTAKTQQPLDITTPVANLTKTQVQQFLIDNGYLTGIADGQFGPQSTTALAKFKAANNLPATGGINPQTMTRIRQLIAPQETSSVTPSQPDTTSYVNEALKKQGYTELSDFQAHNNLQITGKLDPDTQAKLFPASAMTKYDEGLTQYEKDMADYKAKMAKFSTDEELKLRGGKDLASAEEAGRYYANLGSAFTGMKDENLWKILQGIPLSQPKTGSVTEINAIKNRAVSARTKYGQWKSRDRKHPQNTDSVLKNLRASERELRTKGLNADADDMLSMIRSMTPATSSRSGQTLMINPDGKEQWVLDGQVAEAESKGFKRKGK